MFAILINTARKMATASPKFARPSSNLAEFRSVLAKSKKAVILSGAGISAESGIPTFRGAGGYWRKWNAQTLATPEAFDSNPSLVWEFYHHRREVVFTKQQNPAHYAIAEFQKHFAEIGKEVVIITQNIDELHKSAGATDVIELHGSLYNVRCTMCQAIFVNTDSPICSALQGKGAADLNTSDARIPIKDLPTCKDCGGLLRPHVVWFGESLYQDVLSKANDAVDTCDVFMIIGTSAVVYPAAAFAPEASRRGVPVAEFNIEDTNYTNMYDYYFQGRAGEWVPKALQWPLE